MIPNQTLKKSKPSLGGELCWVDLFTLTCSEKEETFENLPNSTDQGYCGTSGISLEKQSGHFCNILNERKYNRNVGECRLNSDKMLFLLFLFHIFHCLIVSISLLLPVEQFVKRYN